MGESDLRRVPTPLPLLLELVELGGTSAPLGPLDAPLMLPPLVVPLPPLELLVLDSEPEILLRRTRGLSPREPPTLFEEDVRGIPC